MSAAAAPAERDVCVGGAGQGGHFVMTGSVKSHLHNLARAALIGRYPILLQVTPCSPILGTQSYVCSCTQDKSIVDCVQMTCFVAFQALFESRVKLCEYKKQCVMHKTKQL